MIQPLDSDDPLDSNDTEPPAVDYLPARMVNEYVYCPRLFYLMHVEGQFADSYETVQGRIVHRRVDGGNGRLDAAEIVPQADLEPAGIDTPPEPPKRRGKPKHVQAATLFDEADDELDDESDEDETQAENEDETRSIVHARSITLSSDSLGVIAKLDLAEAQGKHVTPIDYKRGRPRREADGTAGAWPPERVQIALQALVLRDNGYQCDGGMLYFNETRQRVDVPLDDALIRQAEQAVQGARAVYDSATIPPPLVESPKCPKCSLAKICLPDETARLVENRRLSELEPDREVRPIVTARDERRPIYFSTQGLWVGKKGDLLQARAEGKLLQEIRLNEVNQVNLMGNVQLSTQAMQTMLRMEIPVAYFTQKGYFYGVAGGLGVKNILVRREQFRRADDAEFCLRLARELVRGKIRNHRTLLMRNHRQPSSTTLRELKRSADQATRADSPASLLGIEGNAARLYFGDFAGMLKVDCDVETAPGAALSEKRPAFDFRRRNRRPPRDPVNALLSFAYALLTKDCLVAATTVGLDPYLGFYHQIKPGKPALALDLMEPFRPLIAESAVLGAINNRMVTPEHFLVAGQSVVLTDAGRKHFLMAYEQRMNATVTHPLFGYRVSYRRLLEIQTRLLARLLSGEIEDYPVFVTR
jgi:CRISPR-associated protein Cas1